MEKDLRASIVAAGAAAALSSLVGLIAGVGFLALVLRAVMGGLAIGAAVYGAVFLLRKTMPGMFDGDGADAMPEEPGDREAQSGANIDIVLPGEDIAPESFFPDADQARYSASRNTENRPKEEEATELSPVEDSSLLESNGTDDDAEAALPMGSSPERGSRPSSGFEDLDTLPDLEGFSDSFTSAEFGSGGSPATNPPKGYNSQAGSGPRPGQEGPDPAALAQAVRTILKRDQKG